MTLSLPQISDRLELEKLVVDYAYAIDERAFERLDEVFTADAYIDYRAMGGIDGNYPVIRDWLPKALAPFAAYMHVLGNFQFEIEGDTARGKIACINPMEIGRPDSAGSDVMVLGLWYLDRYQRTAAGWRICERIERRSTMQGMPEWMAKRLALGKA